MAAYRWGMLVLTLLVNTLAVIVVGFFLADCPCCGQTQSGCYLCPSSCFGTTPATATAPPSFSVTIAGTAAGTCTSCGSVDGTYVADFFPGTSLCQWLYTNSGTACGYVRVGVQSVYVLRVNQYYHYWQVNVEKVSGPAENISFRSAETAISYPGGLPDCESIVALALPFHSKLGFGNACSFTGATATITSGTCPP